MKRNILLPIVTILVFIFSANAGIVRQLDTFEPTHGPFIADGSVSGSFSVDYSDGNDTIGTQRDSIIVLGRNTKNLDASVSFTDSTLVLGFDQDSPGYFQLQLDGADSSPTVNVSPGLGNADLTDGNSAFAFLLDITCDHDALYSLRVYGSSLTVFATYNFTAAATFTPISYFIPYTLFSGSLSSFISVNAITLSVDVSVPNLDTTALDTSVYTFATFGYIVSGYAYKDCNRDGVQNPGEIGLEGANVTLRNTPSNTVFKTVLTDANGLFTFVGLGNFTYNVCVTMPGFTLTQPATGCRVAVLTNFKDVTDLAYGFTTTTSLTAPPPKTVEACGCTTPNCTGTATGASCGTGGILYNDSTTVTVCPQVITRTWYINGTTTTATQIITVPDTTKPTIVDQAANQNVSCSNQVPKLSDWVAAHGYANATDCNSIRWFNNWNGTTPGNGNCGFRQVTFFANDTCGNVNTTTATWTVYDGVAPVFTSFAANITTDCNTNGDDFNALNQWLRNHANANATDNCEKSITYTNNYNGTLTRGCNNFVTVTFTASDNCGSAASVDGTFTIKDDTPPFVSTPPKDSGAACKGDGSAVNAFNAWLSANGGGNASDACTAVVWKNNATELQLGCNQPNIVQFNVSDLCSHTLTFTANFLITDSTGPKLTTQPTNLRVNCSADVAGSFSLWVANHAGAIAQDDCTGSTVSWSDNSNTIARPLPQCNAVTVTFTVRDACNTPQSTSFQATFTTFDDTPPYFTADPQNKQVLCNSDINAQFNQWLTSNAGATANDTCNSNPAIRNDFPVNGTIPSKCKDSVSVLFTVSDGCNNIISKSAIFSVYDDSPPVISPQAKDQYQECNFTTNQVNYKAWLDSNGGANATDSCGGVSWTHNGTNTINNNVCSDIRPIAFTATDSCGLQSVTIATFNLTDTKDPILQSPAVDRPAQCDGTGNINDFANWITTHANASATDACTGVFWTTNSTVLNPFVNCTSITPILFTANDRCAHSVSTVATYSISDTQSPVITTQPTDASAECDGYGNGNDIQQWLNNHGGAVAFDICDLTNLTWTTSFNNTISTCRTVNVIFTVTDSCGRSASANANFTVIDSTKPVFNPPVANQTVQCDGLGNTADYQTWVNTMGGAKATDVCSISVTYNNTAPAVGPVGCGTVRAAFLATDQCGNTGVSIGTFTVIDSFPPTIDNEAQDQTVECDGSGNVVDLNNWLLVNGGATATDTCSTQLLVWSNDYRRVTAISNCTSLATVTFSVTDTCNNTARTTATFTIVDTTPPSVAPSASNLLLECDVAINPAQIQAYLANHGGAAAEDQCSATVRWSNNFVATADQCGNGVGVVFTVQDICGNAATTNASITVDDNVPPKFSSFPADKALDCSNCSTPACTGTPVVSDDCAAASSLSLTYTDFNHTQVTIGYCPGDEVITRVWKVTDPCGNVNIRNQTLIVQFADPTGPCVPTLCPPCDEDALTCCEANSAPQSCLPVSCKAVPCLQVPCTPVECIPQVCGSFPPSPTPTPAVVPGAVHDYYVACEPVYVYVYNDDGINDEEDNQPVIKYIYEYIYGVESVENSASSYSLLMSFFLLCISLFF